MRSIYGREAQRRENAILELADIVQENCWLGNQY